MSQQQAGRAQWAISKFVAPFGWRQKQGNQMRDAGRYAQWRGSPATIRHLQPT
jgi:hypothetical protein